MDWLLLIYLYVVETYSARALDNGCRSIVHFSVGAIGAALSSVVLIGRTDGLSVLGRDRNSSSAWFGLPGDLLCLGHTVLKHLKRTMSQVAR
jgi:hypothetical protein